MAAPAIADMANTNMANANMANAEMATPDPVAPFRFMDLADELRNKVYKLLLCSFGIPPARTEELPRELFGKGNRTFNIVSAPQWNDPAILRVSSQIHREAYDIMVKTNRFVRINSPGSLSFGKMIGGQTVPTIATGRCAARFNEHLVDITISPIYPILNEHDGDSLPNSAVIRGYELENFCRSFATAQATVPGLSKTTTIVITVAPMSVHDPPWYQDGLMDFFSEATQKAILGPLRVIRGINKVEVHGLVIPHVAATLETCMMADEWGDPNEVTKVLKTRKEFRALFYREGRLEQAFCIWGDLMREIDRMREGSSWAKLIELGGEPWIDQIAEMQCSIALNVTLASMKWFGPDSKNASIPLQDRQMHRTVAEIGLEGAINCGIPGHWKEGYTWRCPAVLVAKIEYRTAVCIRLWGQKSESIHALRCIRRALALVPDDPVILEEEGAIIRWATGM